MNAFPWGGSEALWAKTARCALNEGHQVLISVFDWSVDQPAIRDLCAGGAVLHVRPRGRKPPPGSLAVRVRRRLSALLPVAEPVVPSPYEGVRAFAPDVLCLSQGGTFDVVYDRPLQHLLGTLNYCLLCQHNYETGILPYAQIKVARAVFGRARRVFFVADRNRETAERQLGQALPHAVTVGNPLNVIPGDPVPFPPANPPSFACVARLDCNFKGQDILLQVLGAPRWRERRWQLNLYGQGPDEAFLRDLAAFYGLGDRVHFRGHVDDIRGVWAANHLQLMPSVSEGTPLALAEAMLCGRPAVVTDVGGNASLVREGFTGFVAEAPSPAAFGRALERAWGQAGQWEAYGADAYRFARSHVDLKPDQTLLGLLLGHG